VLRFDIDDDVPISAFVCRYCAAMLTPIAPQIRAQIFAAVAAELDRQ